MTVIERVISKGQLVPLVFTQVDLAVSQTDVQLKMIEAGATAMDVIGVAMPFDGEVVGVSADLDTAATAGSLTAGPTIDGVEVAGLTQTFPGSGQSFNAVVKRGTAKFVKGAKIGAEITTNGTFAPITADLVVVVWVLLYVGQGAVI